jgi:oligopeptidase B
MTLHGDTRIDNYFWLRDDERSRPEVLDYLREENEYGRQVMATQRSLQERVLKEIIDRIPPREVSAPYSKNGYRYRQVYEPGCEYAIYQRQSVLKEEWDEWEVLLDSNQRAAQSEFYTLGGLGISPDNMIMALAEDYLSRRQYGLRLCNLQNGEWYPEVLENVSRNLPGAMIRKRCGMSASTRLRCCLIRSGGIPWALRRVPMCWSTRRRMKPSTSASIRPPPGNSP